MKNTLSLTLLASLAVPASAAVFTVTKTADTLDGACDHDCSLREAVVAANATAGPSLIVVGPGTYTLSRLGPFEDAAQTGDLDVTGNVVLLGAGAEKTVLDGNQTDRVLDVARPASLEIHDMTVRNGWARGALIDGAGGAIRARGRLTVVRSHITDSKAESAGGGIYALDLTARDSTISNNIGIDGGGIFAVEIHLANVTISGNLGRYGGGAFLVQVAAEEATQITVTANTATSAGGGLYVDLQSCPASLPDDECPPVPPFILQRSLVAGNTAEVEPDCSPASHIGEHNLFGVGDRCHPNAGDRAGTLSGPLLARLTALQDNGGPTPTHLPLADSPALDLAPAEDCLFGVDQRGRPRPANGNLDGLTGCDAGAVERSAACQPDDETLCLGAGDRFQVTVRWTALGQSGAGKAMPLTLDSGAFWFFDPANVELNVKVLDGCGINNRFWVFLTGLTDVGVEVEVRDTYTSKVWTFQNSAGSALPPRLDTNAFDTCSGPSEPL